MKLEESIEVFESMFREIYGSRGSWDHTDDCKEAKDAIASVKTVIEKLDRMINLYEENRTDVTDNIVAIRDDEPLTKTESRFIMSKVPEGAKRVEYDTLTTLLSWEIDDEWKNSSTLPEILEEYID